MEFQTLLDSYYVRTDWEKFVHKYTHAHEHTWSKRTQKLHLIFVVIAVRPFVAGLSCCWLYFALCNTFLQRFRLNYSRMSGTNWIVVFFLFYFFFSFARRLISPKPENNNNGNKNFLWNISTDGYYRCDQNKHYVNCKYRLFKRRISSSVRYYDFFLLFVLLLLFPLGIYPERQLCLGWLFKFRTYTPKK